ncbi:MAG: hypothetical protein WCW17_02205 [Patescibacteria group bacterium]
MNKKAIAIGAVLIMSIVPFLSTGSASAYYRGGWGGRGSWHGGNRCGGNNWYGGGWGGYNRCCGGGSLWGAGYNKWYNRPIWRIYPCASYWNNNGLYNSYPAYNNYFPNNYVFGRRIVFYDIAIPTNSFYLDNNNVQGDYALNEVKVGVNSDYYNKLYSGVQNGENPEISVDTRDNSIMAKTSSGEMPYQNANISAQ